MLERRVRTAKYLVFRTRENPWKQRETGGRKSLSRGGFRVRTLQPLGYISVYFCLLYTQKIFGEKSRREHWKIFDFQFWKPFYIKDFRRTKRPSSPKISSRSRYDHFDSPPYISAVFRALRKCKKNRQERYEILKFDPAKTLINQGFPAEKTAKANAHFESAPLWPLRYLSMYL